MELVYPITDRAKLDAMADYLFRTNTRDYVLFELGINIGLRVTDFTQQKVGFYRQASQKGYIDMTPEKTKKFNKKVHIPINEDMRELIDSYIKDMDDNDWMFPSRKSINGEHTPITRQHIHRILNEAARAVGINDNIGCHSMRKTFGYWHYYYNKDIRLLMDLFNHSDPEVTLRYIGVTDEKKKESMNTMSLGLRKLDNNKN